MSQNLILVPKKYPLKQSIFIKVLSVKLNFLYIVETNLHFLTLQKKFHVNYHFFKISPASQYRKMSTCYFHFTDKETKIL